MSNNNKANLLASLTGEMPPPPPTTTTTNPIHDGPDQDLFGDIPDDDDDDDDGGGQEILPASVGYHPTTTTTTTTTTTASAVAPSNNNNHKTSSLLASSGLLGTAYSAPSSSSAAATAAAAAGFGANGGIGGGGLFDDIDREEQEREEQARRKAEEEKAAAAAAAARRRAEEEEAARQKAEAEAAAATTAARAAEEAAIAQQQHQQQQHQQMMMMQQQQQQQQKQMMAASTNRNPMAAATNNYSSSSVGQMSFLERSQQMQQAAATMNTTTTNMTGNNNNVMVGGMMYRPQQQQQQHDPLANSMQTMSLNNDAAAAAASVVGPQPSVGLDAMVSPNHRMGNNHNNNNNNGYQQQQQGQPQHVVPPPPVPQHVPVPTAPDSFYRDHGGGGMMANHNNSLQSNAYQGGSNMPALATTSGMVGRYASSSSGMSGSMMGGAPSSMMASSSSSISQQHHHHQPNMNMNMPGGTGLQPNVTAGMHNAKMGRVALPPITEPTPTEPIYGLITVSDPLLVQPPSILNMVPPHWTYQVQTQLKEGGIWLVRRRFKHVVALEDRMRMECLGSILPPRPEKHVGRALEEASALQTPEFAMQRAAELQVYLNSVVYHPQAGRSNALRLFLALQDDMGTAWPEVSSNAFTRFGAVASTGVHAVTEHGKVPWEPDALEDNAELLALASSEGLRMGAVTQAVPKLEGAITLLREYGESGGAVGMELSKLSKEVIDASDRDLGIPIEILSAGLLRYGRRQKRLALELSAAMAPFVTQYKLCRYEKMAFQDRRNALQKRIKERGRADQRATQLMIQQQQFHQYGTAGSGRTDMGHMERDASLSDQMALGAVQSCDMVGQRLKEEVNRISYDRRTEWSKSMKIICSAMKEASTEQVGIWEATRETFLQSFPEYTPPSSTTTTTTVGGGGAASAAL